MMVFKNLFHNHEEEKNKYRLIDARTVQKMESIAHSEKSSDFDVKIWIPTSMKQ